MFYSLPRLISYGFVLLLTLFSAPLFQAYAQLHPADIVLAEGYHYRGVNGVIEKTALHEGELYISGNFSSIGNEPFRRIARWDGTKWNQVGNGLNSTVRAFESFQGSLYAIGIFEEAESEPDHNLTFGRVTANGFELIPAPEGTQPGYAMLADDEHMFVILTTQSGANPQSALYSWDGENWKKRSDDFLGVPRWMATDGESIFVSSFSLIGDPDVPGVFGPLGKIPLETEEFSLVEVPQSSISHISYFDGSLFMAGTPASVDGNMVRIVRMENDSFLPVTEADEINVFTFSEFITFDDNLYLTGRFTNTDQNEFHNLLKYDPTNDQFHQVLSHGTPRVGTFNQQSATSDSQSMVLAGMFIANDLETHNLIQIDTNLQVEPVFSADDGLPFSAPNHFLRIGEQIYAQDRYHAAFLPDGSNTFITNLLDLEPESFPSNRFLFSHVVGDITYVTLGSAIVKLNENGYTEIAPYPSSMRTLAVEPEKRPAVATSTDELHMYQIRRFNGALWRNLGEPVFSEYVATKLRLYEDSVILTRYAPVSAGETAYSLLSYDISQGSFGDWVPFRGVELTGNINDLFFKDDDLYISGEFYHEDEQPIYVAVLSADGHLTDLSGELNGTVYNLTYWNDLLIAIGVFTENAQTGEPLHSIAGLYEGTWTQILEGYTADEIPPIQQVYPFNNNLYLMGRFSTFGSYVSSGIAKLVHPELPPVSIEPEPIPARIALKQNYPNPFNPTTLISYALPEAMIVSLEVYDVTGRRVAQLENGMQQAGSHTVSFDGSRLASGIYLYRLRAGDTVLNRSMLLVK